MMKKILCFLMLVQFTSCGILYRSIEDPTLIQPTGYETILFVYMYYPEEELEFYELYFENLEELFEKNPTKIASTYIKIESFEKGFIKPDQEKQDLILSEIFNHQADLVIYVNNIGGYINDGPGQAMYKNTATDVSSNKEVWASQFIPKTYGLKHKKNLSKSISNEVYEDLEKVGILR